MSWLAHALQDRKHVQQSGTSRNFVLAVDASTTGEKLCRWALDNVARPGDRLHALHVLPTMSRPHGLQAYAEALLGPQLSPSEAELQQLQHRKHTKLGQRLHALMPTDGTLTFYVSELSLLQGSKAEAGQLHEKHIGMHY
jgi:hypothetical protein